MKKTYITPSIIMDTISIEPLLVIGSGNNNVDTNDKITDPNDIAAKSVNFSNLGDDEDFQMKIAGGTIFRNL